MNWPVQSIVLPAAAAVLGAAVLALLHLLKVQPPRRTVATIMFWRRASQQEHRRVLWGRFSRWRSFLMLLLVVLLLAAALSGLRWPRDRRGEPVVMVIDAGFSMTAPAAEGRSRMSQAVELARADLSKLGNTPVSILSAGEWPQLLARPEQPAAVARLGLNQIQPQSAPAASSEALALAAGLLPAERGHVLWYTDQADLPEELPQAIRDRVQRRAVGSAVSNAAILAVTFEPIDSDSPQGRLRVRVGAWGPSTQPVEVRLARGGDSVSQQAPLSAQSDGIGDAVFEKLQADGGECTIGLVGGGAIAADDLATMRLPRRPHVAFRFDGEVPESLRRALLAIGGGAAEDPAGILVTSSATPQTSGASVRIVSGAAQVAAGTKVHLVDSPLTKGLGFEGAVCGAGTDLRSIDSSLVPLIGAGESVLVGMAPKNGPPRLVLSDALFSQGSNLPQRPGFFLLLMCACRQMSGWTEAPLSVPIERRMSDPLWPPSQDSNAVAPGSRRASDLTLAASEPKPLDLAASGFGLEPWQIALAAAVGLLFIEGLLQAKGRIV